VSLIASMVSTFLSNSVSAATHGSRQASNVCERSARNDLRKSIASRLICVVSTLMVLSAISGCQASASNMNVVVFNYGPRAIADVYVDGQHVGAGFGAFGPGGTGGKISCCHRFKPGAVRIDWMLGGALGDPLTGKTMTASAELSAIKPGARYVGVYLFPDGSVALDTAKGIPDDQLPRARK
jgi:hypothetical protein